METGLNMAKLCGAAFGLCLLLAAPVSAAVDARIAIHPDLSGLELTKGVAHEVSAMAVPAGDEAMML